MSKSVTLMAGTTRSICQAWHLLRELERARAAAAVPARAGQAAKG